MPKILSYDLPVNETRDIEFPLRDGSSYWLRARKTSDKILIEVISDSQGRITTAADFAKHTKLTIDEIRDQIELAFKRK